MTVEWWTEERRQQLIVLHAQGLSMGRIARELHVTRGAIAGQITRLRSHGTMLPAENKPPQTRLVRKKPLRIVLSPHRNPRVPQIPRPAAGPPTNIVPLAVLLWEMDEHQCHYVLDESRGGRALYCGLPTSRTYCEGHEQVVYR